MPLFGLSKSDVEKMEAKRDVEGLIKALKYKRMNFTWSLYGNMDYDKGPELGLKDALVRSSAAEALGRIGDAQVVDGLIDALRECFGTVRLSASEALGKIGGEHAVDGLIALLNDKDGYTRVANLASVAQRKDWYSKVRSAAAESLGKIDSTAAVFALTAALKDPEVKVRDSAEKALKELEKKVMASGYQPSIVLGTSVIDLRSEEEQAMASHAQSTLHVEDEEIAKKLVQLSRLSDIQYAADKAAYEKTVAEFRRIGEQLCANGGDERMRSIAYRVEALGGRSQDCEMYWAGICGWIA